MKYITLLRGINVSGKNTINMADLRQLYQDLELKNVKSYIQTGNVVFETQETSKNKIIENIKTAVFQKYKYDIQIIIREQTEFASILTKNPFLIENTDDLKKIYVAFLNRMPAKEHVEKLQNEQFISEKIYFQKTEIYLHYPNWYGKSKINHNFLENRLKCYVTLRNWRSIQKIQELLETSTF